MDSKQNKWIQSFFPTNHVGLSNEVELFHNRGMVDPTHHGYLPGRNHRVDHTSPQCAQLEVLNGWDISPRPADARRGLKPEPHTLW